MSKTTRRSIPFFLCLIFFSGLFLTKLSGCAATPEQIAQIELVRDNAIAAKDKAESDLRTLQAQVATLDENDPVRVAVLPKIEAALKGIDKLNKQIPLLNAVIKSAKESQIDPGVADGLKRLPVVGPYADLIVFGLTLAGGIFYRAKAKSAEKGLNQTIAGIDAAHPEGLPEPLKQALASAQDTSTKALVVKAKGG